MTDAKYYLPNWRCEIFFLFKDERFPDKQQHIWEQSLWPPLYEQMPSCIHLLSLHQCIGTSYCSRPLIRMKVLASRQAIHKYFGYMQSGIEYEEREGRVLLRDYLQCQKIRNLLGEDLSTLYHRSSPSTFFDQPTPPDFIFPITAPASVTRSEYSHSKTAHIVREY